MVFMETLAALALLGIVAVAFLSGLTTSSRASIINDRQSTAASLARSQMDWVKDAAYTENATTYAAMPLPGGDTYSGYSVNITAAPLNSPDDGIQKITVTILRSSDTLTTLEGYKLQ